MGMDITLTKIKRFRDSVLKCLLNAMNRLCICVYQQARQ